MAIERRDIEEVGEAVEALGIMLEKELGAIKQHLTELYQFIAQIKDQDKSISQELERLKVELKRGEKLLQRLETTLSRNEAKLTNLQKDALDEEDYTGEIKNELLAIKRELQFARGDLKELLRQKVDPKRNRNSSKEKRGNKR